MCTKGNGYRAHHAASPGGRSRERAANLSLSAIRLWNRAMIEPREMLITGAVSVAATPPVTICQGWEF
jgi:hypothetical protein